MRQIVIASHDKLASGMKDTLNFLGISSDTIHVLCAYQNNKPIDDEIKFLLNSFQKKDEIIVFTDIVSGSVNQAMFPYIKNNGIKLITGMNLPLLMAVSLFPSGQEISENQFQKMILDSRDQIQFMNDYKPKLHEDDE